MQFEKIMIVDDSQIDRWLLIKTIRKTNLASMTVEAATGAEALDIITSSPPEEMPELIFLDVNMPAVNGFEFLEAFSKLSRDYVSRCRIVMISSVSDAAEEERAMEFSNVTGYYLKPLSIDMLNQLSEQLRHTKAS